MTPPPPPPTRPRWVLVPDCPLAINRENEVGVELESEYILFKSALGSGVKSMAQVELKTLKEEKKKKSCSVLLPTSERSPPRIQLTSQGLHRASFFYQPRPWPRSPDSPRLATTSGHPLSSLPFWGGRLVTVFFPRTLLYSPALQAEDIFPRKPGGTLNFLPFKRLG